MIQEIVETPWVKLLNAVGTEGKTCFDPGVWQAFHDAPYDVSPEFEGPPGYPWPDARGKDHPRLGRFVYAFAKWYRPEWVVEVGTNTGGTAIAWARALHENGKGRLICVDNDAYSHHAYPGGLKLNLAKQHIPETVVQIENGDSARLVPELARRLRGQVNLYLVDGDHRYEGALADIKNGLPMMKSGGLVLVHDVDRFRRMAEATVEHPAPVYEAFMKVVRERGYPWCLLRSIRKHLGIFRVI